MYRSCLIASTLLLSSALARAEDRLYIRGLTAQTKLDLSRWTPLAPLLAPERPGLHLRFGQGVESWEGFGWEASASAALFALAALNAFVPRTLPSGVGRIFSGTGRPADSLLHQPAGPATAEP